MFALKEYSLNVHHLLQRWLSVDRLLELSALGRRCFELKSMGICSAFGQQVFWIHWCWSSYSFHPLCSRTFIFCRSCRRTFWRKSDFSCNFLKPNWASTSQWKSFFSHHLIQTFSQVHDLLPIFHFFCHSFPIIINYQWLT